MATTLTSRRVSGNGSKLDASIQPAPRRQRNRPVALVAVAFALAGMIGFVTLWAASSDRQAVLAVARPVKAGDIIKAEDLAIATVPEDAALQPMPASAQSSAVGKTAAIDLAPGTLLVASALGTPASIGDGEALVGVEVPSSSAPVDGVHSGDRVQIIKTAKGADPKEALGEVITEGRVVRVGTGKNSTATAVVSIIVPADKAATVAGASASQRVALVVVPGGGQ